MKNLRIKIGGAILTFAFVFGISAVAGTTAQAQHRNNRAVQRQDDRYNGAWRRNRNQDPHRRYDRDGNLIRNNRAYGRSQNDGYGNNGGYATNRGYGNNGSYGNNGGYGNANQVAMNEGYQYGLQTGASDAQRNQSFSPQRSRYYKNASSQAFRNGFVQGYNQGYRQYAGNRNGTYRRGNTQNGIGIGSILGGIFGQQ